MPYIWYVVSDDPETSYPDVEDALDDYGIGEIVELEECQVLRTVYAVQTWGADGECEAKLFDTFEEAEAWVARRKSEEALAEAVAVAEADRELDAPF